jgi:hypothetical protein
VTHDPLDAKRQIAEYHEFMEDQRLVINPEAMVAPEVLEALLAANEPFRVTWARRRADLKTSQDYDRAIATILSDAGQRKRVIVAAVIQHRRLRGAKPTLREDYFERLLRYASKHEAKPTAAVEATMNPEPPQRIEAAADYRDRVIFAEQARLAGHTVSNYIRALAGLMPIFRGNDPIEQQRRIDQQW